MFPWLKKARDLETQAKIQRGKLAEAIVKNDRVRTRLAQKAKESPVAEMMADVFRRLDEAKRE